MCGRYTLRASPAEIAEFFELTRPPEIVPRANICPTTQVLAIVRDANSAQRNAAHFQWGLIPSWAKDPKGGAKLINARGETVADKPSFRSAFKRRRCLIPADGFYEWQKVPGQKKKQPWHIRFASPLVAFAGLHEHWTGGEGSEIDSCTIITTQSNSAMSWLHDRMPVVLAPDDYAKWLNPDTPRSDLEPLLRPCAPEGMVLSDELANELLG